MKSVLVALALLAAAPAHAQTDQGMADMPGMKAGHEPAGAAPAVQGVGQVKAVDARGGTITIHHGPIAALGWPAMTMTFNATPEVLQSAKAGQTVAFTLQPDQSLVTAVAPR
jgi:Cu(I)/Ag(I) efflux system protein CusF